MTAQATTTSLFLLLALATATISGLQHMDALQMAQTQLSQARNWFENHMSFLESGGHIVAVALRDCAKLYYESEFRLARMLSMKDTFTADDELTWVSAVMANHRTCLDGLRENGYDKVYAVGINLTISLTNALTLCGNKRQKEKEKKHQLHEDKGSTAELGVLASWNTGSSKADFTVAEDGSGTHKTIREAADALAAMGHDRPGRVVIYVKSGVYSEKVEIPQKLYNVMLVGDGIDNTIVTGDRDIAEAGSTLNSATIDVSGDGFWARDVTFQNTAGPERHQAVAIKVSSDKSVFYKCGFKAYQDTLYAHSNRQFYRNCQIYGTVDFIFGDASAVFQDSDIFVRKPMQNQFTSVTAHGRDKPDEPTGFVVHGCRVRPSSDLDEVKESFRSYLGRPWKEYSRTVFMKTEIDGIIDPKGWKEWEGNYALSTLYYGEFMNTGSGASTENRVDWPGFHVMSESETGAFTVGRFMDGESWIGQTGVPFWAGIKEG